jgi:hypothetical protein
VIEVTWLELQEIRIHPLEALNKGRGLFLGANVNWARDYLLCCKLSPKILGNKIGRL